MTPAPIIRIVTTAALGLFAFGTVSAQPGTILSHQVISDTQGNFNETLDSFDEFGGALVGLGDLDGPGPSVAAFAVGAPGDDDGGSGRGAVYVLFLDGTGAILSTQKISDLQGNFTAHPDPIPDRQPRPGRDRNLGSHRTPRSNAD